MKKPKLVENKSVDSQSQTKRGRGRPRLSEDEKLGISLTIRMDQECTRMLSAAQRITGKSRSYILYESAKIGMCEFVERLLDERHRQEIEDLKLINRDPIKDRP